MIQYYLASGVELIKFLIQNLDVYIVKKNYFLYLLDMHVLIIFLIIMQYDCN